MTDGVFSMDGDVAPLRGPRRARAGRYGVRLVVDEAHGTGHDRARAGAARSPRRASRTSVDVIVGTLGKALGSYGAYAACDERDGEIPRSTRRARSIFSTAPPPPAVAGALAALSCSRSSRAASSKLQCNARALRSALAAEGFALGEADRTHDRPARARRRGARAMRACELALERGVFAQAIRPPTVPVGSSRLRLAVMASHAQGRAARRRPHARASRARRGHAPGGPAAAGRPPSAAAEPLEAEPETAWRPGFADRMAGAASPSGRALRTRTRHRRHGAAAACSTASATTSRARRVARAVRGLFVTGDRHRRRQDRRRRVDPRGAARAGERVAAFKPVLTGTDEPPDADWPPDDELLAAAAGMHAEDVAPERFGPPVSPHLAAALAGTSLDPAALRTTFAARAAGTDAVVVEGVGGLLVPLAPDYCVRDLARDLGLPLVIAARPGLGTINHTLLTLEAARAAGLRVAGVVLTPWPEQPSAMELVNRATIARLGEVEISVLPRMPRADVALLAASGAELPLERWLS